MSDEHQQAVGSAVEPTALSLPEEASALLALLGGDREQTDDVLAAMSRARLRRFEALVASLHAAIVAAHARAAQAEHDTRSQVTAGMPGP